MKSSKIKKSSKIEKSSKIKNQEIPISKFLGFDDLHFFEFDLALLLPEAYRIRLRLKYIGFHRHSSELSTLEP